MIELPLSTGGHTKVNSKDFVWLSEFTWWETCKGPSRPGRPTYVMGTVGGKSVYLHRLLMAALPDEEVDHRDGDGLNNQRRNLRLATPAQNRRAKQRKRAGLTSKFRGVSFELFTNRWKAQIRGMGRSINLGRFDSEKEAARAYDKAARKYFGEFASPNFP